MTLPDAERAFVDIYRREPERLLARQQRRQASAVASPSWETARGRSARSSPTTSTAGQVRVERGRRCRDPRRIDLRLPRRASCARLRRSLRRAALRLRLRLRRLPRLRAEGRLRRRGRPPRGNSRRRLRLRRPPDRLRPRGAPHLPPRLVTDPELHRILDLAGRDVDADRAVAEAERWIEETSRRLARCRRSPSPARPELPGCACAARAQRYLDDIAACKRYLAAGHSYEICLTNKVAADADARAARALSGACAGSTRRPSPPTCASATSRC